MEMLYYLVVYNFLSAVSRGWLLVNLETFAMHQGSPSDNANHRVRRIPIRDTCAVGSAQKAGCLWQGPQSEGKNSLPPWPLQ